MQLPFITSVAGVSFHPEAVSLAEVGDQLHVTHDPANRFDSCAVAVHTSAGVPLGHLPAPVAARVVDRFGNHCRFSAEVVEVLGGEGGYSAGLRIRLTTEVGCGSPADTPQPARSAPAAGDTPDEPAGGSAGTTDVAVRSLSGRELGTYVGTDGDDVLVACGGGNTRYPARLVTIASAS